MKIRGMPILELAIQLCSNLLENGRRYHAYREGEYVVVGDISNDVPAALELTICSLTMSGSRSAWTGRWPFQHQISTSNMHSIATSTVLR